MIRGIVAFLGESSRSWASEGSQGLRSGAVHGVSPFTSTCSPLTLLFGAEAAQSPLSAQAVLSGFLTSRTMSQNKLLYKLPSRWQFVIATDQKLRPFHLN